MNRVSTFPKIIEIAGKSCKDCRGNPQLRYFFGGPLMQRGPKRDAVRDRQRLGDGTEARDMLVPDLAVNAAAFNEAAGNATAAVSFTPS